MTENSMNKTQLPVYIQIFTILGGVVLLFFIMYIGRNIIIPVYIGMLFALLMLPFSRWLERIGASRTLAAVISIIIVLILLTGIGYFFVRQIQGFSKDMTVLSERVEQYGDELENYLSENFNIRKSKQMEYWIRARNSSLQAAVNTAGSFTSFFIIASVILPMSMYFFLAHRKHYKQSFLNIVERGDHSKTETLFDKEQKIIGSYLGGIFLVVLILSICNVTALTLFGIEHALLFGVMAGFLNIIPVVGTLLGSTLPVLFAFIMRDSIWYAIGIAIYFTVIQILESSVITPNIVGKQVKVNPYAILLAIFIGGELWGPAGMVLFIPMVAQLKMMCTMIEPLKPFGFLLSEPDKALIPRSKIFSKRARDPSRGD